MRDTTSTPHWRLQVLAGLAMTALIALGAGLLAPGSAAEGRPIPPPALDDALAATGGSATVVLAGGCFWGVQAVFQHVKGVTSAVSGYAGGAGADAEYERVGSGTTGHAEAVRVTYDPSQVSYGQILQVYFSVAHDPTQLNRQGPDYGSQYRSAIFPADDRQAEIARSYIAQLDAAKVFGAPIVTTTGPAAAFFAAEDYHQDYLVLHPDSPYILINDVPKVEALARLFPDRYRARPVLVSDLEAGN